MIVLVDINFVQKYTRVLLYKNYANINSKLKIVGYMTAFIYK